MPTFALIILVIISISLGLSLLSWSLICLKNKRHPYLNCCDPEIPEEQELVEVQQEDNQEIPVRKANTKLDNFQISKENSIILNNLIERSKETDKAISDNEQNRSRSKSTVQRTSTSFPTIIK